MAVNAIKIAEGYVEIETRYDGKTITRMSQTHGRRAGDIFSHHFGYASQRRFKKLWGAFFKPLNNLKRWLTRAKMPALLGGIFGSVLAGLPTIGHLTSAVGVGMIPAMLAWGSTIGIVRALLGNLSKSIKNQTLKALDDAAEGFKTLAQETAAPGLNAFLEEAIEHTPILNKYVKELAGHVSDVGFEMAELLDDQKNIERIKITLEGTARATGKWYGLLDDAVEVLLVLAAAGTPLFEKFTDSMVRVGHTIHDWVMIQEASGALQRHLEDSYETLEKIGRAGRDFLIGLFNIISGGVFGTEKVAGALERWGASFREWSTHAENVEKVRKVIEFFTSHVDEMFRFAASATVLSTAITAISKIKAPLLFVNSLLSLGPIGFILFGIGSAVASIATGFFLAYQQSEEFREKLHSLVREISTRLAPIFKDWYDWVKTTLLPLLEKGAIETLDKLVLAFRDVATALEDNQENLKELRPLFIALVTVMGFFARELVVNFVEAIAGAIYVLGTFGDAIKKIREAFFFLTHWVGVAVDWVKDKWGELGESAEDVTGEVTEWFKLLPGRIINFIKSLPGRIAKITVLAMEGMVYAVAFGLGKVVQFFQELPRKVLLWIVNTWDDVYTTTKRMIGSLVNFISKLPERLTAIFFKAWESVLTTTSRWLTNIVAFIKKLPGRIITAIINLPNLLKSKFGESWGKSQKESEDRVKKLIDFVLKIPGRVFTGLGKLRERLVNRFAEGWSQATGTQKEKVKAIIDHILGIPGRAWNALRTLASKLASRAREGFQAFRDAASAKVQNLLNWVFDIPDRIMRALGGMKSLLFQKGKDTIQGLWDGMKSVWEKVKTWIGGIPSWIKQHKGPISFDRQLLVPAGKAIMEGLGTGLFFGSKGPLSFVTNLAGSIKKMLSMNVSDLLPSFGGGGGGGVSGSWNRAINELIKDGVAFAIMSTFRPGAVTHASGRASFHSMNRAVDLTGPNMMAIWQSLLDTNPTELIYSRAPFYKSSRGWSPISQLDPITLADHFSHVHAAYRQGKHGPGLPEDILGIGRSGRGYAMHRGEQILRQGETTNNSNVTHVTNYVTIDPSNMSDMNKVIDLMKGLQSTVRMHGAPARARVA